MRILFILPCEKSKYFALDYHHGVAQISACLKTEGHEAGLFILSQFDTNKIHREITNFEPDILAYSFTSDHAILAKKTMEYTKRFKIYTIAGGVHATMDPLDIIPHCNAVCVGEGEEAMLDLVQGKTRTEIPNLWVNQNGQVLKSEPRSFLQQLDDLPFSDRSLFDYQKLLDQDHRADFMAGRGCPYLCSYCVNKGLKDLADGKYVRWHSPHYLIEEIKSVLATYNRIESICFQDDTFAMNRQWLDTFAPLYKKQIGMPFVCNLRIGSVNNHTIDLLAESGCSEVRIGVEQGNEDLRRTVLSRNMNNDAIIETFKRVKKAGIKVFAYNMVGIPGETKESIKETIRLNRQLKPDKLHVSMFRPYPGTPLYDYCNQHHLLTRKKVSSYFEPVTTLQLPTISSSELEYYFRIFRIAALYPRLTPIASLLAKCKLGKRTTLYDLLFESALSIYFFMRSRLPKWIKNPLFRFMKA